MTRKISDLKEAKYNPRIITKQRLENLHRSLNTYGDLSGIVFNRRTKTLISGHQRLSGLRSNPNVKTKIRTRPVEDSFGTVAEGWVIAKTESGIIRIPYREVDWSDKRSEKAANIAANAHGGDFDKDKLSVILADLAKDKKFDVDIIGLDPLTVRTLMPKLPNVEQGDGEHEEDNFEEYSGDSFEFEHTCPKCNFKF